MKIVKRQATSAELKELARILAAIPTDSRRWRRGAENALVTWSALMLAVVLAWLILAWLARTLLGVDFGWRSPMAPWVLGLTAPLAAVVAVISSIRWMKSWKKPSAALRKDISGRVVHEERYSFTEATRYQEPEHGGLLYFLRTTNDRVLALFDRESQELGVQGDDPLGSTFAPQSELVLVRAPRTRFVVDKRFSGALLDAGEPLELMAPPSQWPEPDECCSFAWSELEARLAKPAP